MSNQRPPGIMGFLWALIMLVFGTTLIVTGSFGVATGVTLGSLVVVVPVGLIVGGTVVAARRRRRSPLVAVGSPTSSPKEGE